MALKTTFLAIFLLMIQSVFCQTDKVISGQVTSDSISIPGIDVINMTNVKATITDYEGKFRIVAQPGDIILIGGKNYSTLKIRVTQHDMDVKLLAVVIQAEIIQLETVEVRRETPMDFGAQKFTSERSVDNMLNSPRNQMVYNGSIADGLNLIKIGKLIGSLFKNKDKRPASKAVVFKDFVAKNFPNYFLINTLHLTEEEIPLFIEFCSADEKSDRLAEGKNILEITDFLLSKKQEFDKLKG